MTRMRPSHAKTPASGQSSPSATSRAQVPERTKLGIGEEIFVVVPATVDAGCNKILETQPDFHPPDLDDDSALQLVEMGAYVEFCAVTACPVPGHGRMDQAVKLMKGVGTANAITTRMLEPPQSRCRPRPLLLSCTPS